jgi:hypothetical protein
MHYARWPKKPCLLLPACRAITAGCAALAVSLALIVVAVDDVGTMVFWA